MIKQLGRLVNAALAPLHLKLMRTNVVQRTAYSLDEGGSYLGEETVLAQLREQMALPNEWYVDVGAADGVTGSNTVHLAKLGWKGLCLEGSTSELAKLATLYRGFDNVFMCRAWITPSNINTLLAAYDVPHEFGVLSLDIDSYDYYVLAEILSAYRPSVIIAELNEKIPPPIAFTVTYSEDARWNHDHFFGMSASQVDILARQHKYGIAAIEYNNIFLVDLNRYTGRVQRVEDAYNNGYRNRTDRTEKFAHNADVDRWLTIPTKDLPNAISQYFAKYAGKFEIRIVDENVNE